MNFFVISKVNNTSWALSVQMKILLYLPVNHCTQLDKVNCKSTLNIFIILQWIQSHKLLIILRLFVCCPFPESTSRLQKWQFANIFKCWKNDFAKIICHCRMIRAPQNRISGTILFSILKSRFMLPMLRNKHFDWLKIVNSQSECF